MHVAAAESATQRLEESRCIAENPQVRQWRKNPEQPPHRSEISSSKRVLNNVTRAAEHALWV